MMQSWNFQFYSVKIEGMFLDQKIPYENWGENSVDFMCYQSLYEKHEVHMTF